MTKREEILQAVETLLKGMASISAAKVGRSRVDPYNTKNFPCLSIEPVVDPLIDEVIGINSWKLTLKMSVYAKGEIADQAADPIIEELHNKMVLDRTLGGRVQDLSAKGVTGFDFFEADTPSVCVNYEFELSYRTSN